MNSLSRVGVSGLLHLDTADVQVVVAPEEADGARLQHVHVVLPVQVHFAHWSDVVCVSHHETPGRAVLELLIPPTDTYF